MKQSIESLELNTVLQEISSYTLTREGRDLLFSRKASRDPVYLAEELRRTGRTAGLLSFREPGGISTFPDIDDHVQRVSKQGSVLDGEGLFAVGIYLQYAGTLYSWFINPPEGFMGEMPVPDASVPKEASSVSKRILKDLEAPGAVKKDHPRLKPLYRELERARQDRSELSYALIREDPSLWQQETPTVRNGRIVLPVKSSLKSKVPGFVHGISASGNTMYLEPHALAESNNQVIIQEQKIQAEVLAVLRELSSLVRGSLDAVHQAMDAAGRLDYLLAKARYSMVHDCEVPNIGEGHEFSLIQARHPLLGRHAVPIHAEIPPDTRAVIITGPNAGGKTVTVKTMGLLSLMVQHGIPVPASSQSTIPLFSSIHADIGDDQSIAESLSTFSAHMKKIADMLRLTDEHSLVILDELASGTDTFEGSALAKAVVEYCLNKGCLTLVTSHHMSLKQFAYTDSRVINASMEFDETRKVPTYRILFGSPGSSYAVETAQRMGIPEEIIVSARKYLSDQSDKTTRMIHSLEKQELELHMKLRSLESARQELEQKRRETDLKMLQIKQQELMFRKKDLSFINSFMETSRSELENLIRSLREGELTREKLKKVKDFQDRLAQEQRSLKETVEHQAQEISGRRGYHFSPGMSVLAGKGRTRGIIRRKGKKPGFWFVEMGSLRMDIHENDLVPIEFDDDTFYDAGRTVEIRYERQGSLPRFELDLRGMTLEQAAAELEQQIDRAVLHGVGRFGIIHGKGEGILQRGIQEILSHHVSVKQFFFAPPEQGGFGKTIVELKT